MLDIRLIRENPDLVKDAVKRRNGNLDATVDEILEIDAKRREISTQNDQLRNQQKTISKQIPQLKKEGKDIAEIMESTKKLSDTIAENTKTVSQLEARQRQLLLSIPNIPHESVPAGLDDSQNTDMRHWGRAHQV